MKFIRTGSRDRMHERILLRVRISDVYGGKKYKQIKMHKIVIEMIGCLDDGRDRQNE